MSGSQAVVNTDARESSGAGLLSIVGGESTGKSTLAAALAEQLPGLLVPETLRDWVERNGRVPRVDEQRAMMLAHAEAEIRALGASAAGETTPGGGPGVPPWVISDSGPLMTAVYSILYFDDDSLVPEAIELSRQARLVVWCAADIPWTADEGQRDGPATRDQAQNILGEVLASSGLPWLQVVGSTPQRLVQVMDRL